MIPKRAAIGLLVFTSAQPLIKNGLYTQSTPYLYSVCHASNCVLPFIHIMRPLCFQSPQPEHVSHAARFVLIHILLCFEETAMVFAQITNHKAQQNSQHPKVIGKLAAMQISVLCLQSKRQAIWNAWSIWHLIHRTLIPHFVFFKRASHSQPSPRLARSIYLSS